MRSPLVTVLLAILAVLFGTLAAVQVKDNDLSAVFGAPPLAKNDPLYSFDPEDIARLRITNSSGDRASFLKRGGQWIMEEPANDRADFRHLEGLVAFARNLRIEDIIPGRTTTAEECGFRAGRFDFELADTAGHRVARFSVGRRTAWHRFDAENNLIFETVFIRPTDEGAGDYVYVCSAPEVRRSLLDRGFGVLRDHRPFLFNWDHLASVNIRNGGGDLLLARESMESGWKITKPLTLRTDPEALGQLLKTLTNLEAAEVHDPGSVTTLNPDDPFLTVNLATFDEKGEVVPAAGLTIEPPATPDATTVLGKVEGRPAVFEFPLNTVNGRPDLSQLAVTINDLRSKTLADLNIAALQTITITARQLQRPLIVKLGTAREDGRPRWIVQYGNDESLANEITVAELLSAITRDKVTGFASDAAADLAPFGLDDPEKSVLLEGGSADGIELLFSRGTDEQYYAMRRGAPSVMNIDGGTYAHIATQPFEWRDTLLWPFNIIDLVGLRIERKGREPLNLSYNFITQEWTARQAGEDVTPLLNSQRANNFLTFLESLRVANWIGVDAPQAQKALSDPVFVLTVLYKRVNDLGDTIGVTPVTLEVARATQSRQNRFFFGRLSGDPEYFVFDLPTAQRLAVELLEAPGAPVPPAE